MRAALITGGAVQTHWSHVNFADNTPPDFAQNATTRKFDEDLQIYRDFDSAVSATDPDGHNLSYTLSGADAPYFGVRSNGQLYVRRVFDYETRSAYEVVVTAADPPGDTDAITVSILINDVDEAPVFDAVPPTLTVAENTATDTTTGKTVGSPVTATDPEGSTVSYALDGTDAGSFAINPTSGQITTAAQLDRETKAEHSVTVIASDPAGNQAQNDVTIQLTNVNESPVYENANVSLSLEENTLGPIGPVTPSDPDENDSLSYVLGGADAGSFAIDGSGRITAVAGLDRENPTDHGGASAGDSFYVVTVTATDADGLNDTVTVTIEVTNAAAERPLAPLPGAPPLDGSHTGSGSNIQAQLIARWLAPNNTGRPTITGYDVDYRLSVGTPTWSRQTAAATARSATVPVSGLNSKYEARVRAVNNDGAGPWLHLGEVVAAKLKTLQLFFFPTTYTLTEAAAPTSKTVQVFMLEQSDRAFVVPLGTSSSDTSFEEDDITLSPTQLSFASGDGGNPNNPVKTFTITPQQDDDTSNENLLIVFKNTPQGVTGGENTAGVIITDPDVNSPPLFNPVGKGLGSTTRSVNENTASGVAIGSPVTATDTASGKTGDSTTLTYGLAGADASSFQINAASGQISTSAALNYSTKNSYSLAVTVHDGKDRNGNVDTSEDDRIDVTIDVLDLDEAPGAPAAPTVIAASADSLTVSWLPPTNTGPPITDYNVRYRIANNGSSFTDAGYDGTVTSTTLTGLFTNTAYDVEVQAVNDEGTSDWSLSGPGTTGLIPLEVAYEFDSYETVENGLVGVRVELDQSANRQIEVPISVTPASGTDTGDYTINGLTNNRLTFQVGTNQKVFTVSANQDGDPVDEEINLGFDTSGLPGGRHPRHDERGHPSYRRSADRRHHEHGRGAGHRAVQCHLHFLRERERLHDGGHHGRERFRDQRPHGRLHRSEGLHGHHHAAGERSGDSRGAAQCRQGYG